jgi:hypothetical protein
MKPLLEYTYGYLTANVTDLCQAATQGSLAGHEQQCELIKATLKMLCPIANIATAEEFSQENANFSVLLPNLLDIGPIQDQSVAFLSLIISRKLYAEIFLHFLTALPSKVVSSVQAYSSADKEGSFAFSRTLASSLCSMISLNLHLFSDQRLLSQPQLEPALNTYFSALVKIVDHPSRRLSQDIMKDVTKIFRDDTFVALFSWLGDVASHLLSTFAMRSVKVVWDEEEAAGAVLSPFGQSQVIATTDDEDAELEFENKEEYLDHFGIFRSNIRVLIAVFGNKFPAQCVSFLGQYLLSVKANYSVPVAADRINSAGGCSFNSNSVLQWENIVALLDSGIKAIVDGYIDKIKQDENVTEQAVVTAIL